MANTDRQIRQSHYADDMWYSAKAPQLQRDIKSYLAEAPPCPVQSKLFGLVAPHAGHFFSGHVAGAAFAGLTPDTFDTVILIGPDHRGAAPGQISAINADTWRTPLGEIPVNWDMLRTIQAEIELTLLPTDDEHSLEIELPFLQMTLQKFKLVPLMMGGQTPLMCRHLGETIVKAIRAEPGHPPPPAEEAAGREVLLVASSDLSHFFDDDTARRLDKSTLQFMLDLDADGLVRHVEEGRQHGQPLACGAGPIAAVIHAVKALGATQAGLIKYATSADVHPRKDSVVGYAAVAFCQ